MPILNESTRTHQVYTRLIQGHSLSEIVDELKITEADALKLMNNALARSNMDLEALKVNWASLTMLRTEGMLKKMLREFDESDLVDNRLTTSILATMKLQGDANGALSKVPTQPSMVQNNIFAQTFVAGSDLYNEALATQQQKLLPEETASEVIQNYKSYSKRTPEEESAISKLENIFSETVVIEDVDGY